MPFQAMGNLGYFSTSVIPFLVLRIGIELEVIPFAGALQ